MAYSRYVLGGSDEDYSRSVLGGSDEDNSRSVLGGSDEYFSRSILGGSDEINEIHCEPCMKEGNTVAAVKYCVDCAEYLCGQCFKSHAKFKAFQNHVTNDVNTVNPVAKTSSKITTSTVRDTLSGLQIDPKTDQQISSRTNVKSSMGSNRKVTAKLVSSMDVSSSSDKNAPYIRGLIIVHSHYCVVTDNENKTVKVVDTRQMSVVSEAHISDADWLYSITSVNDDQVAVTVEIKGVHELVFFSLSTSGNISHTDSSLDIENIYPGIIHHKDHFYGSKRYSIDIFSMSGRTIKTIKNDAFDYLFGIALSNDHNTIYVCSVNTDTVFSVDLEGNIIATYKDQDLKGPVGVTVDSKGFVYVCCNNGTHCVHQLTADLKKVQVIISGQNVSRCIFNRDENRLYVAFRNTINMYDMNY